MDGDGIRGFVNSWSLLPSGRAPQPDVLGNLFLRHIQRHPQLLQNLVCYEIPQGHTERNHELLDRMVNRHLESQRTKQARTEMSRGNARPAFPVTDKAKVCLSWERSERADETNVPGPTRQTSQVQHLPKRTRQISRTRPVSTSR